MATPDDLVLAPRQLHSLADGAHTAIRCLEGSLWLTVDHDPRDIVLGPGESFTPADHRRVLIYALEPSRFVLVPGSAGARVAGARPAPRVGNGRVAA